MNCSSAIYSNKESFTNEVKEACVANAGLGYWPLHEHSLHRRGREVTYNFFITYTL
jgi:hypothetical protein